MKNTQKIGLLATIIFNVIYVFTLTGWIDKKAVWKEIKLIVD